MRLRQALVEIVEKKFKMSLTLILKRQEQYLLLYSEAYSEPSRISMTDLF